MSGYRCPNCNGLYTNVRKTFNHEHEQSKGRFKKFYARERICQHCGLTFLTHEIVVEKREEAPPKDYQAAPPIKPPEDTINPFL